MRFSKIREKIIWKSDKIDLVKYKRLKKNFKSIKNIIKIEKANNYIT